MPWSLPRILLAADLAALAVAGSRTSAWLMVVVTFPLVAAIGGYYRSRLSLLVLDDLPGLLGRLLSVSAVSYALHQQVDGVVAESFWNDVALAAVAIVVFRMLVYSIVRLARARRVVEHKTLIVGAGEIGRSLYRSLEAHPEYGLRPIGFHDPDPLHLELPMLGEPDALADLIQTSQVRVVILAFSSTPESELVRTVRECSRLQAEIFYVPRLFDLHSLSVRDVDDVWGIPLVRLRRASLRSSTWRVKRALDVVVSLGALVFLSPLLALLALLVRLEVGRPILFRQRRVSIDNSEFTILKFRTLAEVDVTESDVDWSARTRAAGPVGRLLRASSLDELPQLWNVLRGDMSLVGPRPERGHFAREFSERFETYGHRHRVPAGLTGLAQIHGLRGDTPIDERARFDNAYVERWSLANDLKIMLRTVVAAVRWRGR